MTVSREQAAVARAAVLRERSVEFRNAGGIRWRSSVPADRSLSFPAQFRSQTVDRDGVEQVELVGVASVTDQPYEMFDMFGEYDETIERDAFTETLASNPDVAFLVNHKGLSMARTTNGTLVLRMGDTGLESQAFLNPKRQDVSDLIHAIDDRTITEMSFAFMLEEGWWSDDFTEFRISKLSLNRGDVSAVNYGANPYTSISARALEDMERLPAGAARAALDRLQARSDLAPVATVSQPVVSATSGMSMDRIQAWITLNS